MINQVLLIFICLPSYHLDMDAIFYFHHITQQFIFLGTSLLASILMRMSTDIHSCQRMEKSIIKSRTPSLNLVKRLSEKLHHHLHMVRMCLYVTRSYYVTCSVIYESSSNNTWIYACYSVNLLGLRLVNHTVNPPVCSHSWDQTMCKLTRYPLTWGDEYRVSVKKSQGVWFVAVQL